MKTDISDLNGLPQQMLYHGLVDSTEPGLSHNSGDPFQVGHLARDSREALVYK